MMLLLLLQIEVTSDHYRVISTGDDRAYAVSCVEALEANHAAMETLLETTASGGDRYTVRLYATVEEYVEKDRELNEGRFKSNWGFSHPDTGEAYAVIQPRADAALQERMRALLLHEAFHLYTYRHAAWMREAPNWLSEGLCEGAAEAGVGAASLAYGSKVGLALQAIEQGTLIPLRSMLEENQSADANYLVRWRWYAQAWLLVKYLRETEAGAWAKLLEAVEAGGDARKALERAGGADLKAIEADWIKWIGRLQTPEWVLHAGDGALTKDGLDTVAYPESPAIVLAREHVVGERYRLKLEARLGEIGSGQIDVLLVPYDASGVDDFVKLYVVKNGNVGVMARRQGTYQQIAGSRIDPGLVPTGEWLSIEIGVEGRTLSVWIEGERRFEYFYEDASVEIHDVRWGIGNYDGRAEFRNVDLQPR